jgi:hypothetical protein
MKTENSLEGIRIRQVLDLIYSSFDDFSLTFVKTNGLDKVFKKKVRLGVPPSLKKLAKMQGLTTEEKSSSTWNHQINKSHNLLLFDIEKNRPFEVKICLLTSFNGIKIVWHVSKKETN